MKQKELYELEKLQEKELAAQRAEDERISRERRTNPVIPIQRSKEPERVESLRQDTLPTEEYFSLIENQLAEEDKKNCRPNK